jgi:hypothetical protein
MSPGIIQVFYFVAVMLMFQAAFVAILGRGRSDLPSRAVRAACGVAALVLLLIPLDGLPLWRWIFAIWANPSVPFLALVVAAVVRRNFGVDVLPEGARRSLFLFGAIAGSVLYLYTYVFSGMDLYFWGWETRVFAVGLSVVSMAAILGGSRSGVVLLLALIAWATGVLESRNGWDYVMDPVFWLVSLMALARRAWRGMRQKAELPAAA